MYSVDLNEEFRPLTVPIVARRPLPSGASYARTGTRTRFNYAGLMTGHPQPSVRLTVSIGDWGTTDENGKDAQLRRWLFMEAGPTSDRYAIMVREPEESLHFNKPLLGKPMSRAEALGSSFLEEFFAVADFVAFNDPAVKSYLCGQQVSPSGRKGFGG